ncbi:hypothetical protein BC936DRAFT_146439 [Jimgerdemannia flammicorona]|uniref:Pentacotripeptide-repeat region of PRORP domain-containing protein n=1 Tax=Jimgerdemannia flammicorona TaxID=994334 RepID=A0A433D7Q1_9FUNG|nr:hypothetical protein BC936DRAFT_146439 [Jimgerdemannia flammicorona]
MSLKRLLLWRALYHQYTTHFLPPALTLNVARVPLHHCRPSFAAIRPRSHFTRDTTSHTSPPQINKQPYGLYTSLLALLRLRLEEGVWAMGGLRRPEFQEIWGLYNQLFEVMDPASLDLTIEDFVAILRIVERYKATMTQDKWTRIIQILNDMKRARLKPTLKHYNAAMTAYSKLEDLEAAERVFWEAEEVRGPVDLHSLHRLLDVYLTCGKLVEACDVLNHCKRRGMLRTYIKDGTGMYYRVIYEYIKRNDMLTAMTLLEQMSETNLIPDVKIAVAILRGYNDVMKRMEAPDLNIYWDPLTADVMPNTEIVNAILAQVVVHVKSEGVAPSLSLSSPLLPSSNFDADLFTSSRLHLLYTTLRDCRPTFIQQRKYESTPFSPNITTYNLLLDAYITINDISSARRTFQEMTSAGIPPISQTLNILVRGFAHTMSLSQLDRSYSSLVHSTPSSQPTSVQTAAEAWDYIPSNLMNAKTFTTFMRAFAQRGCTDLAWRVVRDMLSRGIEINASMYLVMIQGYAENRQPERAQELLESLGKANLSGKSDASMNRAWFLVMQGWSKVRAWRKVVGCFESMKTLQGGVTKLLPLRPDKKCCDATVTALCEMKDWWMCETMLQELARDEVAEGQKSVRPDAWTADRVVRSMLRWGGEKRKKVVRGDDVVRAFELVRRYSTDKEETEVWVRMYNRLINGLASKGDMGVARRLYEAMKKGRGGGTPAAPLLPKPDLVTYNTMIVNAVASKNVRLAERVYDDLVADAALYIPPLSPSANGSPSTTPHHLRPNQITYNVLINAYANLPKPNRPSSFFHLASLQRVSRKMLAHDVRPDLVTFNTLIKGFANANHMALARGFVDVMRSSGIEPDVITFNTLLAGYIRRRAWLRLEELMKQVKQGKIKARPNGVTLNVLLKELLKIKGRGRGARNWRWAKMTVQERARVREDKGLDRVEVWKVYQAVKKGVELGGRANESGTEKKTMQGKRSAVKKKAKSRSSPSVASSPSTSPPIRLPPNPICSYISDLFFSPQQTASSHVRPNESTYKLFMAAFLARGDRDRERKVKRDFKKWRMMHR